MRDKDSDFEYANSSDIASDDTESEASEEDTVLLVTRKGYHVNTLSRLMVYKGRLGYIQCSPMKRSHFAIKYYLLCESKSRTYFHQLYTLEMGQR